ncbi:MAG: Crp/Fnr family transcriptional regulator [Clostridia bacterium]
MQDLNTVPKSLEEIFPRWKDLTSAEREEIKGATRERFFKKGQVLHHGGEDCAGLFLVKEGQIRVFLVSDTGKEITLYRLFGWDICLFSAACVMKNIDFDMHIEAEKDTVAYVVPPRLYEKLMATSLPIADYTGGLMAARFSDVMWTMGKMLFARFDSRLALFLLEQSVIEGGSILRFTHDEIARHMGSAREVVTKMLNQFAKDGLVTLSRGKIILNDMDKLRAMAR